MGWPTGHNGSWLLASSRCFGFSGPGSNGWQRGVWSSRVPGRWSLTSSHGASINDSGRLHADLNHRSRGVYKICTQKHKLILPITARSFAGRTGIRTGWELLSSWFWLPGGFAPSFGWAWSSPWRLVTTSSGVSAFQLRPGGITGAAICITSNFFIIFSLSASVASRLLLYY